MLYAYIFLIRQCPSQSDNDYPHKDNEIPTNPTKYCGQRKSATAEKFCDGVFQLPHGLVFQKCTEKRPDKAHKAKNKDYHSIKIVVLIWSGWQELNLLGPVPKTGGWPLPYIPIFSFFCQIRKWSNLWSKVFFFFFRRRKSEETREKRRFCELSAVGSWGGHTLPKLVGNRYPTSRYSKAKLLPP